MTLFLASVCDGAEAATALANGADIIDAKDPTAGALGALPAPEVVRIVQTVRGRRPISAVLGDLPMEPAVLRNAAAAMAGCGLTYLKIGLFPTPAMTQCIEALGTTALGIKKIGVMFADLQPDQALLRPIAAAGFHGVMIDTAGKSSGRLLDHLPLTWLAQFVAGAHAQGLQVGLAGSLETPDVPRLLPLQPDFLGFRRALCGPCGRAGRVQCDAVRTLRELIPLGGAASSGGELADAQVRLHPGSPPAPQRQRRSCGADRILVRDFVISMHVGAYEHERAEPQRVRFNVDAEVAALDRRVSDMRDVVSYDIIIDAIRLIAAGEHVEFVETLAECIAERVLGTGRITAVTVRVEKLDLYPGSVGVEITRENGRSATDMQSLLASAAHGKRAH